MGGRGRFHASGRALLLAKQGKQLSLLVRRDLGGPRDRVRGLRAGRLSEAGLGRLPVRQGLGRHDRLLVVQGLATLKDTSGLRLRLGP